MLIAAALIVFAYLLGSLSSAIIISKLFGHADPRSSGSGNPGATNVLRSAGKLPAALTLAGDVAKGVIPVVVAPHFTPDPAVIAVTGVAAFLGHLFPVFFGFRGGKGVATFIGVLTGLYWPLGLGFLGLWLVTALITRISSLSALTATALTPLLAWYLDLPPVQVAALVLMAVLLFIRHRGNISRLIRGEESRIGQRKQV
ncbi:MAG: glycerol-3-phosphate 1-O-acyltransferase PlsY [Gammaproteobacteria bacterium]|nr:glycerol-3-phosphate 1-O-acyltransferase PlsY [Gammaproteobacteria bacterium]